MGYKLSRGYEDLPEPPIRAKVELDKEQDFWVTKEGNKLDPCGMTTAHINNCINLMNKAINKPEELKIYRMFQEELKSREAK